MFEFIGRKKRIASKSKYIGEYFGQELKCGRNKKDVAFPLAEKVAKAPTKKALEQVMYEFIEGMHHITVNSFQEVEQIQRLDIQCMQLAPDKHGDPVMQVLCWEGEQSKYFEFPLTEGFGINRCNRFLRSLNLGVDIVFETYCQYMQLIWQCSTLLNKKQEATA